MKLIIAGGRNFANYELLCEEVSTLIDGISEVEIVSGGAKGADLLGEHYAIDKDLKVKRFPADWERFGKAAGFKRNAEMAQYADSCICFWDGQSKGTGHMIELAKKAGLKVKVVKY
jgi:hypothetical protein